MTQEEKQLLLIDLCARLPYGVIAHALEINKVGTVTDINVSYNTVNLTVDNASGDYELVPISDIKPYLRPMSSMTREEVIKYLSACNEDYKDSLTAPRHSGTDWLITNHFDYRGLIEKGLALEAKEGMYEF